MIFFLVFSLGTVIKSPSSKISVKTGPKASHCQDVVNYGGLVGLP